MEGWLWFVLIAYVVADIFVAVELQKVAVMKGFTDNKYFWVPCLLGLPGWLLVIALPDRGNAAEQPVSEDEIPDI